MDFYAIAFNGIPAQRINAFVREILHIRAENVRNSDLHTDEKGSFEYDDSVDFAAYFAQSRAICTINLRCLQFHKEYQNVLCMIEHDGDCLKAECSLAAPDFPESEIPALRAWAETLIEQGYISDADIYDDYE